MDGMQSPAQHELPRPQAPNVESTPGYGKESFGHVTPELKVTAAPGERLVQANSAVSQAVSTTPAIPLPLVTDDSQSSASASPAMADDADVIEKVWVDKAKDIVNRTHGDPHAKSNELSGLKKDYIQTRYGKTISLPNDEVNKG